MTIISKNKSHCVLQNVFSVFLFCLTLTINLFPLIKNSGAAVANASTQNVSPALDLRVDARNHARAFCNGIKPVVSISDFFEFYEKGLDGSRKRILSGPWNGSLTENSVDTYTLAGIDPASGASSTIVFKQADPGSIEIYMTYKAPSRPSSLGFDIVKLSGDLFKGAALEASPAAINDAYSIPVEPLPIANRMLMTKKNRILVKGTLCDLEIMDLTESGTILAADFRNIPWDKEKSIYFGGGMNNLLPSQTYSFRYSIRSLPPTGVASMQNPTGSTVAKTNSWPFYAQLPKEDLKGTGQYQLQLQDGIYGLISGPAANILASELKKVTSMHLPINALEQGEGRRGIFIERIPQGAHFDLPPEGFEIITSPEKVVIRGGGERACLYGVYALMGRLKPQANSWQLECGTIRDWPDLPVRGICIEMLKPAIRDVALMKSYLDSLSRARSNVVIFLHTPQQVRSWYRNVNDGGWTKEQMTEIARYARTLQMDVWGGMGSSFKIADFNEMEISSGTNLYDPFVESSYNYIFSLYEELLQVYRPSTLLISHDEIQGLSVYAAKSGKGAAEILATDVSKIHDWLLKRNVKTAMWGDMLLDFNVWDKAVGAANSLNPFFNSGATHLALKQLPSDVLILDWHYADKKDFGSMDYFRQNGFSVIGSSWHNPLAARTLAQSAKKYGVQGVITTDWGLWATLSPAATTLYAPLCAWSTTCSVDQDNADVVALAETMRDRDGEYGADKYKPYTISLEAVGNVSTPGLFGIGPVLDLRALSSGKQIFGGITFDVSSDKGSTVNNCVVVANDDDKLPMERAVYQGSMKSRSVAFLHTGFVEEPQYRPRKLGRYVVEYENGSLEVVDLLENWNVTDIRSSEGLRHNDWTFTRSPDVLIGARTGWRGFSAVGVPLNLQVFVWRNPHPEQKIRSIRLNAATAPQNSKIALVGLTFLQ